MKNVIDTHLRVPQDLYRKIEALAKKQERSMNRQIIAMLRERVDGEEDRDIRAIPGELERDS